MCGTKNNTSFLTTSNSNINLDNDFHGSKTKFRQHIPNTEEIISIQSFRPGLKMTSNPHLAALSTSSDSGKKILFNSPGISISSSPIFETIDQYTHQIVDSNVNSFEAFHDVTNNKFPIGEKSSASQSNMNISSINPSAEGNEQYLRHTSELHERLSAEIPKLTGSEKVDIGHLNTPPSVTTMKSHVLRKLEHSKVDDHFACEEPQSYHYESLTSQQNQFNPNTVIKNDGFFHFNLAENCFTDLEELITMCETNMLSEQQINTELLAEYKTLSEELQKAKTALDTLRGDGLKLTDANGRCITDLLKHKYLLTEIKQLQEELDRRYRFLEFREIETRELQAEHDKLKDSKLEADRRRQEALVDSSLTSQLLADAIEKYNKLTSSNDERKHTSMKLNKRLQSQADTVPVFVALKPTVHQSCINYKSSTELFFLTSQTMDGFVEPKPTSAEPLPVLCNFSRVISPGSCNSLELYNELKVTINTVFEGRYLYILSVGPRKSEKLENLFGSSFPHLNSWLSTNLPAEKAQPDRWIEDLCKLTQPSFQDLTELLQCKEFSSTFGLTGLTLIHLLKCVHQKSTHHWDIIDQYANETTFRITASLVAVPLNAVEPCIDALTGKRLREMSDLWSSTESKRHPDVHKSINNVPDVVHFMEAVLQLLETNKKESTHYVVFIRVTGSSLFETQELKDGLVLLCYTVDLDSSGWTALKRESLSSPDLVNKKNAWRDISSCLEIILKGSQCSSLFEQTGLQRFLNACTERSKASHSNGPLKCMLLNLPCDSTQATETMHCLRVGLWVMQMRTVGEQDGVTRRLSRRGISDSRGVSGERHQTARCQWKIGQIGQTPMNSIQPSNSLASLSSRLSERWK